MSGDGLQTFLAAAPGPSRTMLRVLIALAQRPRGAALLGRMPLAAQAAQAVLSLGRYDEAEIALGLGWDASGVIARGRTLRSPP